MVSKRYLVNLDVEGEVDANKFIGPLEGNASTSTNATNHIIRDDNPHNTTYANIGGSQPAPITHYHDDRYYTESESNSRFAPIVHTHSFDNYNGWDLRVGASAANRINSGEDVKFVGTGSVSLSGGTGVNPTVTINGTDTVYSHPGYTARNINTAGPQVIDLFTSNTQGHVTNVTLRNMTLADLGYTGAEDANKYIHPGYTSRSINTSGAQVLDTFTSDTKGHVTGITTRTMTLADIGADKYTSWTARDADTTTYPITSGDVLIFKGDTTYIDVNFTSDDVLTFSHRNTSNQPSINNSGTTVIQDVTLDGVGHVTGLASKTLSSTDFPTGSVYAGFGAGTMAANAYYILASMTTNNWEVTVDMVTTTSNLSSAKVVFTCIDGIVSGMSVGPRYGSTHAMANIYTVKVGSTYYIRVKAYNSSRGIKWNIFKNVEGIYSSSIITVNSTLGSDVTGYTTMEDIYLPFYYFSLGDNRYSGSSGSAGYAPALSSTGTNYYDLLPDDGTYRGYIRWMNQNVDPNYWLDPAHPTTGSERRDIMFIKGNDHNGYSGINALAFDKLSGADLRLWQALEGDAVYVDKGAVVIASDSGDPYVYMSGTTTVGTSRADTFELTDFGVTRASFYHTGAEVLLEGSGPFEVDMAMEVTGALTGTSATFSSSCQAGYFMSNIYSTYNSHMDINTVGWNLNVNLDGANMDVGGSMTGISADFSATVKADVFETTHNTGTWGYGQRLGVGSEFTGTFSHNYGGAVFKDGLTVNTVMIVPPPYADNHAATKLYVDGRDSDYLPLAGGEMEYNAHLEFNDSGYGNYLDRFGWHWFNPGGSTDIGQFGISTNSGANKAITWINTGEVGIGDDAESGFALAAAGKIKSTGNMEVHGDATALPLGYYVLNTKSGSGVVGAVIRSGYYGGDIELKRHGGLGTDTGYTFKAYNGRVGISGDTLTGYALNVSGAANITGRVKVGSGTDFALELKSDSNTDGIKLLSSVGTFAGKFIWNATDMAVTDTAGNWVMAMNFAAKRVGFGGGYSTGYTLNVNGKARADSIRTGTTAQHIDIKFWKGTQAQYNAISTKDANTQYNIVG